MKRSLVAVAFLFAASPALAGNPVYLNSSQDAPAVFLAGGTSSAPYQYTALGGAQFNQPATAATALTIPAGAAYVRVCAMIGQFNFVDSTGATPTVGAAPTVGTPLAAGACVFEQGATVLTAFQLINAVASSGTWTATYFK